MTTSKSPPEVIHAQAVKIAAHMKSMPYRSNGEDKVEVAVAMDDKLITIEMPWDTLVSIRMPELIARICAAMRGEQPPEES